jgi:NitT/TauT family transport system substrate-binding protein
MDLLEGAMNMLSTRRTFLHLAAGTAAILAASPAGAAEGAPETTTVRFVDFGGGSCTIPHFVAEDLLRADGFTDVQYVYMGVNQSTISMIANDEVDFSLDYASALAMAVDTGVPMKALGGIHVGCYVLFGQDGINSVLELKGKKVGVGPALGTDPHVFIGAMATYVGLDPLKEIDWVVSETTPLQLFTERKIDAMLAFPPEAQEMQAKKIGHVVVNSLVDPPWSQYFCCLTLASTAYIQKYPIATKRVLRALVKATDLCASDPEQALRITIDKGHAKPETGGYLLQALRAIPYTSWRDHDPEDTIRFFALRLREAGMVRSSPQKVIAEGTDWHFIDELKRELKI